MYFLLISSFADFFLSKKINRFYTFSSRKYGKRVIKKINFFSTFLVYILF